MKAISNQIQQLEDRYAPQLLRDFVRDPRDRLRMVASCMHGRLNLAASECTRYLTKNGTLIEVVDLDGVHGDISDEDLEQFIESFPVGTSALARVQ
jgi:hypothetical protein